MPLVYKQRRNSNTLDVFTGMGWENWHCFEINYVHGKLLLKLVKGKPMQKTDFHNLYESLTK